MVELLTTICFIFAVIDSIGSIPVYLEATKEFDKIHKKKIAIWYRMTSNRVWRKRRENVLPEAKKPVHK